MNGPFQGRIVGGHGTQGFADFALGCRNEPFRLKDGLIRGTTRVALSTFEARHGVLCGFPLLALRAGTMSQTRTLSTQICAHEAKCFTVGHFVKSVPNSLTSVNA